MAMNNIQLSTPPPHNVASYPHSRSVFFVVFCLLLALSTLFGLAGCGDDSPPLFSENIALRFVLKGSDEAIITQDNITAIDVEQDPAEAGFWRIKFSLDTDGAAHFSDATAPENKGKCLDIILSVNGEESIVSSACIYQQITDGVITLTGNFDEPQARDLVSRMTTGHSLSYWKYYEEWGEFPDFN